MQKNRHLSTIAQLCRPVFSQLRHVSTIGKKLLNSYISSMCFPNMVNFGPLLAEIGLGVWEFGQPSKFRVLASLLHRRRTTEVNQTLHDVWPSPGLVHYMYIFRSSCPVTEFCQVQDSLLEFSYIGNVNAWQSSSGRQPNSATFTRGRHLYFDRVAITLGIGPHSSS